MARQRPQARRVSGSGEPTIERPFQRHWSERAAARARYRGRDGRRGSADVPGPLLWLQQARVGRPSQGRQPRSDPGTMSISAVNFKRVALELLQIGIGLGMIYVGVTGGVSFGDGATAGGGAMLVGFGVRG